MIFPSGKIDFPFRKVIFSSGINIFPEGKPIFNLAHQRGNCGSVYNIFGAASAAKIKVRFF